MQRQFINRHDSVTNGTSDTVAAELDVLIIGGGFAGCYLLHNLRKAGFNNTKIVEAGTGLGGIWHWNSYPGARVDSQYPVYQLSIPEVYNTWTWTEQYPGSAELRAYFKHMDSVLDLSKDVYYETVVQAADFNRNEAKWTVHCHNGKVFKTQYLIASVGFAARRYFPDWPGLNTFAGEMHHSSFWPMDGVDVSGKKVAVVGTGATGVQIIQEWAKEADELTVFMRTPNMAMPMRQALVDPAQHDLDRASLPDHFKFRLTTDAGFLYTSRKDKKMLEQSAEAREEVFEELWNKGGFRFIANNYSDMMLNEEANKHAYDFWARKVRARIEDEAIADLLAPLNPIHAFGGKRPSLEQDFYDLFNRPNVKLISVRDTPIKEVVPEGIVTSDGNVHKFDKVALATGFDSITGGLKGIDIRGDTQPKSQTLSAKWDKGVWTYLGMTSHGFPNFFFTYGPQAPTAFSNGPSCVEPQGDWIVSVLSKMREQGLTVIEAREEEERKWKAGVIRYSEASLRHKVDGWYNGQNIPGKPREPLNYAGGLPTYCKVIKEVLGSNFAGFDVR